jgi:hypothetical protein
MPSWHRDLREGVSQMGDESALRQKVRDAIQAGKLPRSQPERTWGGRGCGASCTICGEPVKREDIEFELEFASGDEDPEPRNHHVHLQCFTAWEFESGAFEPSRRASPATVEASCGLPSGSDNGTITPRECDPKYKRGPA